MVEESKGEDLIEHIDTVLPEEPEEGPKRILPFVDPEIVLDTTSEEFKKFRIDVDEQLKYDSEKVLGQGGFGCVYTGAFYYNQEPTDPNNNNWIKVAVKCINASNLTEGETFVDDKDLNVLYEREVEIMTRLAGHPHILRLFHEARKPKQRYLALELMTGGTLEDMMKAVAKRQKSLPIVPECIVQKAVFHTISALQEMRRDPKTTVFHRDMKGANILCEKKGDKYTRFVLADFGLAKTVDLDKFDERQQHTQLGTNAYLDPRMPVSQDTCDLWSIAVMVFQSLTGRLPFGAPNKMEYKTKAKKAEFKYKDAEESALSEQVKDFINKNLRVTLPMETAEKGQEKRLSFAEFCAHPFVKSYQLIYELETENQKLGYDMMNDRNKFTKDIEQSKQDMLKAQGASETTMDLKARIETLTRQRADEKAEMENKQKEHAAEMTEHKMLTKERVTRFEGLLDAFTTLLNNPVDEALTK